MKIEPKIKNEDRIKRLEILYEELKKQKEIYKELKQTADEYNEETTLNQLKAVRQKILEIIYKIRRLLKEFENTESP